MPKPQEKTVHAVDPDMTAAEMNQSPREKLDWERARQEIRRLANETCNRKFTESANHTLNSTQMLDVFEEVAQKVTHFIRYPIQWDLSAKQRTFANGIGRNKLVKFT